MEIYDIIPATINTENDKKKREDEMNQGDNRRANRYLDGAIAEINRTRDPFHSHPFSINPDQREQLISLAHEALMQGYSIQDFGAILQSSADEG